MTVNESMNEMAVDLLMKYKDALSVLESKGYQVRYHRQEAEKWWKKWQQLQTPPEPIFQPPAPVVKETLWTNTTETFMDIEIDDIQVPEIDVVSEVEESNITIGEEK